MTRALLFCGSLQRASANRAALEVACAALTARGVDVVSFDGLASIPPMNSDHSDAPGEDVVRLRAALGSVDGILIAAPEYAGGLAGVVKNALDWIVGSGELYGKPLALLSAGTSGGVLARRDLVRTLSWQGAHVIGSLGIATPNTKSVPDADGKRRFTDAETLREIDALSSSLVTAMGQRPSERLAAVLRLALDAGIDAGPLSDEITDGERP